MPHRREWSRTSRLLADSTSRCVQSPARRAEYPDRLAAVPTLRCSGHGRYNSSRLRFDGREAGDDVTMNEWHIAQLNVGRILAASVSPRLAAFLAKLYEINALADGSP